MSVHLIACQCEFVICQWFAIYALTFKYLSVGPVASQWIYWLQSIFISSVHQLYQVSWYKLPFVAPSWTVAAYYPHHWAFVLALDCINICNMEWQWNVNVCVCVSKWPHEKPKLCWWAEPTIRADSYPPSITCMLTVHTQLRPYINKKSKKQTNHPFKIKATQSIGLTWAGQGWRKSRKMLRFDWMSTWGNVWIQQIIGNKS